MPIYIQTGGGAAQLGAGLGAGIAAGAEQQAVDAKQAKKDAEMMTALQAGLDVVASDADAKTPDMDPGEATMIPTGSPLTPAIPAWLNPGPSQAQVEMDKAVAAHKAALGTFTDPEAAKQYLAMAEADLQQMTTQEAGRRVATGIQNAIAAKKVTDEEVMPLLEALQSGADPAEVYMAWGQLREQKVEEAQRGRRALRLRGKVEASRDEFAQRAQAALASGADDSEWLAQQADRIDDLLGEFEESLEFGLDDFDFDAFNQEYRAVKYALNPEQRRVQEQRDALILEQVKGLARGLSSEDSDVRAVAMQQLEELTGEPYRETPTGAKPPARQTGGGAQGPAQGPDLGQILPAGTKTWEAWDALPEGNRKNKQDHAAGVLSQEILGDSDGQQDVFKGMSPEQLDQVTQYVLARLGIQADKAEEGIGKLPDRARGVLAAINVEIKAAREWAAHLEETAAERAKPRAIVNEPNRFERRPPAAWLMGNQ